MSVFISFDFISAVLFGFVREINSVWFPFDHSAAHEKEATKRKSDVEPEATENGKHDGEGDGPPAKVAKVDEAEAESVEAKEQPEQEKSNGEAETAEAEAKAE